MNSQQTTETESENTFSALQLDARLTKALNANGFRIATEIQLRTIPIALERKDILMRAKTGSGKTLAFCLPLLENILRKQRSGKAVSSLILVPTRELIVQISNVVSSLINFMEDDCIRVLSLIGIGKIGLQNEKPRLNEHPHVLICTPGRLVKHLKGGNVDLSNIECLIIDEADLMMSYDFEGDIKEIVDNLSNNKRPQMILCSATLNTNTSKLQELLFMHHPTIIETDHQGFDQKKLTEYYFECDDGFKDKFLILFVLLKLQIIHGKCLIFVHSIDLSYRLKLFLEKFLISSAILNPKLPLNSRQSVIEKFNRGLFQYLITTDFINKYNDRRPAAMVESKNIENGDEYDFDGDEDGDENEMNEEMKEENKMREKLIAYRGVDFREVSAVINFSAPYTLKKYIHRVGRTARAGNFGVAITLVTRKEMKHFRNILYSSASMMKTLPLKISDLNAFRYRCNSVRCSITTQLVKHARLNELRMEILNSKRLQSHFGERKREFELLKHDKMLQSSEMVKPHMSHIPRYMMANSNLLLNKNQRTAKTTANQEFLKIFGKLPPIILNSARKQRLRKAMQKNPRLRKQVLIRRRFNLSRNNRRGSQNLASVKNWNFLNKSTLVQKSHQISDKRVYIRPVRSWRDPLKRKLVASGRQKPSLRGLAKRQIKKLKKRRKLKKLAKRR